MPENKKSKSQSKKEFSKPLLAILITITLAPISEIFMQITKHFGLTKLALSDVMSLLVLKNPNLLVGIFVTLLYGSWLALLMYYSPKFLGFDYLPLKTMFVSMSLESWLFNIFGILGRNERLTLSVGENLQNAFLAAITGLVCGFLFRKYLFQKTVSRKGDTMKHDKPLLAMLFGIAPLPLLEGYAQIMKYLGLTTLSVFEVLSLMWLRKPSWLLGILAMFGIGSWIGLIIYHSVKILGVDYLPIKTILIEFTTLFLVVSIYGTLGGNELLIQNASGFLVHTLDAVIGGLCTGFLMKKYLFC